MKHSSHSNEPTVGSQFAIKVAVAIAITVFVIGVSLYKLANFAIVSFFKSIQNGYEGQLQKKPHNAQLVLDQTFTDQEKGQVSDVFSRHSDIDYSIFGQIYFDKSAPSDTLGFANWSGKISLDETLFQNSDLYISQIVGHELSHLFDKYCVNDDERNSYLKLRGYDTQFKDAKDFWFVPQQQTQLDWKENPQEDFAEVYYKFVFKDDEHRIQTQGDSELSLEIEDYLTSIQQRCVRNNAQMNMFRMTSEASIDLERFLKSRKMNVKVASPPEGFGPWNASLENPTKDHEFFLISKSWTDDDQFITLSFHDGGIKNQYFLASKSPNSKLIIKDKISYYTENFEDEGRELKAFLTPIGVFITTNPNMPNDELIELSKQAISFE